MTSSFNHLRYDVNTYQFDLKASVAPGEYALHTPVPHCRPCFASDARMTLGTTGGAECTDRALVDVESDLINITKRATNCPTGQYAPTKPCASKGYGDCRQLPISDSRLNNPPATLRCTGWNRWEWLCTDPQARSLVPFDWNVNTDIVAKDNHRPLLPTPLDPGMALPPGSKNADPSAGAPQWMPSCMVPNDDAPIVSWRSCSELDRIRGVA
jgi:hypothetical protein